MPLLLLTLSSADANVCVLGTCTARCDQQTQSQLRDLTWKTKELVLLALFQEVAERVTPHSLSIAITSCKKTLSVLARVDRFSW